jgi:peptide-methionine (S)-S-oxide reductase
MRGLFFLILLGFLSIGFFMFSGGTTSAMVKGGDLVAEKPDSYPTAIFAGGCFWCVESEFRAIDGVLYTRSGYIGGALDNPTYRDITTGQTGHAEAVEVTYDPAKTDYEMLTEFFLTKAHDPTQLNRQGVDVGTQYRSAIFPANDEEQRIAKAVIKRVDMNKVHSKPIVTTIEPMATFWTAEEYHQQYYEKYEEKNGRQHIRVIMKKGNKR